MHASSSILRDEINSRHDVYIYTTLSMSPRSVKQYREMACRTTWTTAISVKMVKTGNMVDLYDL